MRAYSHQAYVRPRCRRRAASLTPFHSLRVGNAGGQLVWNVRTWPAMPREKVSVISVFDGDAFSLFDGRIGVDRFPDAIERAAVLAAVKDATRRWRGGPKTGHP